MGKNGYELWNQGVGLGSTSDRRREFVEKALLPGREVRTLPGGPEPEGVPLRVVAEKKARHALGHLLQRSGETDPRELHMLAHQELIVAADGNYATVSGDGVIPPNWSWSKARDVDDAKRALKLAFKDQGLYNIGAGCVLNSAIAVGEQKMKIGFKPEVAKLFDEPERFDAFFSEYIAVGEALFGPDFFTKTTAGIQLALLASFIDQIDGVPVTGRGGSEKLLEAAQIALVSFPFAMIPELFGKKALSRAQKNEKLLTVVDQMYQHIR